jgi:succinate dehydrogenase / fumarate reductase, cytochrome b subunit
VKAHRQVYLNLWRIRFPIPAIVSILHRISGIVIFLGLPFMLYLLSRSLISQDSFDSLSTTLEGPGFKVILWILLVAVLGHFLAGIRHLLMDVGIGEGLKAGRRSAALVLLVTAIYAILIGFWI